VRVRNLLTEGVRATTADNSLLTWRDAEEDTVIAALSVTSFTFCVTDEAVAVTAADSDLLIDLTSVAVTTMVAVMGREMLRFTVPVTTVTAVRGRLILRAKDPVTVTTPARIRPIRR
jgi:hypothetical protein